ncbi:MAG: hypothetical protein Q9168_001615 [Polycauliona sp. 1 TL-2023]
MADVHPNQSAEEQQCHTHDDRPRRPSLYASIRLARFVYHVKERLKCRARRYWLGTGDVTDLAQSSLDAQARQDLDREVVLHQDLSVGHAAHPTRPRLRLEVPRLLEKLDEQLIDGEPRTSSIATCDHLFLAYNARAVTRFKGIDELRHIYDLTTLLLARLASSPGDKLRSGLLPDPSQEKFIANLDHILRCLRQATLEALIHHGMETLQDDLWKWHQFWLRDRQLQHGWFSEWPGGRRPLSTTWPWNIRPSLVVLWGVCWMFYDNSTRSVEQLRQQLEDREVASSFWSQPTPRSAATSSQAHYPASSPNSVPEAPFSWPQDRDSYSLPAPPLNPGSDPTYSPLHRPSASRSVPIFGSPQYYWDDPQLYEPRRSQQQLQPFSPATRNSSGTFDPYAPSLEQAVSQEDSPAATLVTNLLPPMGPMQNYPSPHSDVSKDEIRPSNFSVLPSNNISPSMMFAASPTIASHPSQASPGRRSEEPPRNSSGRITCLHPSCARELPVFGRKCEWTTGSGFSRKENLQEHLRRVHRHSATVELEKKTSQEIESRVTSEPRKRRRRVADKNNDEAELILPESRKRRREDEDDGIDTDENHNPKEDLSAQVKRLRRELQEKDERLRRLEETVELLTKRSVQPV